MAFLIKEVERDFALQSIQEVGFDSVYVDKAVDKYQFKVFKAFGVSPQQASIIKQLALSLGADAAVHREVITCKVDRSDLLIGGSLRQLKLLASKLEKQPFSLPSLAWEISKQLKTNDNSLVIRNKTFNWGAKTYLMGVLNVTPDSFSDGGEFLDSQKAIAQAIDLIKHSDILDIGGESTRPYAAQVSVDEEIARICPVITSIRDKDEKAVISVDTRNAKTAKAAMLAGADIINDVSGGGWDEHMLDVAAEFQAPFVLMHSSGSPLDMQDNPSYDRVVDEVYLDLSEKIDSALARGVAKENIIVDIGIGFGKNLSHNLELMARIEEFKSLGCPILAGVSRKSFMSEIVDMDLDEKDISTLAINAFLVSKGVDIARVHNPQLHKKPLEVIDRLGRN